MHGSGDHIFVLSAFKFAADILYGPVPMDQKQPSGGEDRTVDTVCHIDIHNDHHCLLHHKHDKDLGRKQLESHHGQLRIDQHIGDKGGKDLREDNLRIFQVSQAHAPVHHRQQHQDHGIYAHLQHMSPEPELSQLLHHAVLKIYQPVIGEQPYLHPQAHRGQAQIDQSLAGFQLPQLSFIGIHPQLRHPRSGHVKRSLLPFPRPALQTFSVYHKHLSVSTPFSSRPAPPTGQNGPDSPTGPAPPPGGTDSRYAAVPPACWRKGFPPSYGS